MDSNSKIRYNVISCGPEGSYKEQIVDLYWTEKEAISNCKRRDKSSAKRGYNFKHKVEKTIVHKNW